ncbi:nucleotidyl transferase AbiEii/AbiGii toxin family protein, partial [Lactobacillus helveticus]
MKNYVDEKQFKADIRKYAQRNHISGNEIGRLWQEVMLDDLLKRISISKYKDNFILKGGLLLSAVVGINNRSTEDIDGEIKGFDLTEDEIEKVFTVICNTKPDNDPLEIILTKIEKIHENEEYKGFRLHFNASFKTIKYPLKVDISTGDVITPREIHYNYMPHLEDEKIEIWAYNMETVTADYRNSIFYKEGKI